MGYNHEFPYTDAGKYNDDWLLNEIRKVVSRMDEFINLNTIKYADPIEWNITTQYEANTIVVDAQTGNAYISTKPVPSGVLISNTDYWTEIYNYSNQLEVLRHQIAPEDEGKSPTASKDRKQGSLVWLDDKLIVLTKDILAGTAYIEATSQSGISGNFIYTSVDRQLTCAYDSDSRRLTLCGTVDGNTQIISRGDYHIYDGASQAIIIQEVE